jgi:hypothetical protein
MNDSTFILSRPRTPLGQTRQLETIPILNGGAGAGAEKNLAAIAAFNRKSTRYRIEPTYADPAPGRVDALLAEAVRQGVEAFGVEARVEEVALGREDDRSPLVLQIDRASDIARTLSAIEAANRVVFVYLLVKRPNGNLTGLRMYLRAGGKTEGAIAERFFRQLGEFTLPNGSAALFGDGADAEDLAREPLFRAWFAEHLTKNLPKAVTGLDPECAPFEVTTDGRTTKTLHLVGSDTFRDPVDLAEAIIESPTSPIQKGRDFEIGEFTPTGVRFATVRLRKTDGKLAVQGAIVLDRESRDEARRIVEARVREREALRVSGRAAQAPMTHPVDTNHAPLSAGAIAALALVLAAAAAGAITATNPVQSTD